jgi:hypothetical protein
MVLILALVIVGTTIWIGIDASQREWSDGSGTAAWVLGALLLWIVVFPYYLVRRSKAPLKGSTAPAPEVGFHDAPVALPAETGYEPPRTPISDMGQYSPLSAAQTPFADTEGKRTGVLAARCVSCAGPIESHLQVFGSNQCASCRDGGKPRSVTAERSTAVPTSEPSHTLRNAILVISGLIVLSLVGCSMLMGSALNSATATHTEIVHVYAPPDGCWSGAIGDSTKEGCGPADIQISQSGPIAAANAQKQADGDWQLGLALEINGKIVDSSVTTAQYGVAEVSGGGF